MQIGLGIGIPFTKSQVWLAVQAVFTPAKLFESGANGLWLDPSDPTTMFQDAAGTTPVTAVEQPVGRILDKSGRGNHAFQSNLANRPTLSARYNLLTKTEDISSADWSVYLVASRTATKFIPSTAGGEHYIVNSSSKSSGAVQYTAIFDVKDEGYGFSPIVIGDWSGPSASNGWYFCVDVSNGNYTAPKTFGSGWTVGIVSINRDSVTGICTVTCVFTTSAVSTRVGIGVYAYPSLKDTSPFSFAGNASFGIYLSKVSLVPTNQASLPYQRVNTSTDYDSDPTKFPWYLKFNGTSSSLQTASINFTATDKMFVAAGVRKLIDGQANLVAELSNNFTNSGSFGIFATAGASIPQPAFASAGTSRQVTYPATGYNAPITNVLSGIGNISGDQAILRVNGTQAAISTADQGTGNFGNYPLYIGARAGTSLFFNGYLYQLVIVGKQASADEITSTETFINTKTKAY